jgi:hypothetical protein
MTLFCKKKGQSYLLLLSINDWLPKDHIVGFILDSFGLMALT